MKKATKILITLGCLVLVSVSWLMAITTKSDAEKQRGLIDQAAVYTKDDIYILAVPLLEEAAAYNDDLTMEAEEALKDVYLHLINQAGYKRKYLSLLDKQMARKDATPEIFEEAARYYLAMSKEQEAFSVLREGIMKTGSKMLVELYEANRYMYKESRAVYQDVTAIYNNAIQVMNDGFWGLAEADGTLIIPCQYDSISTYEGDRVVVRKGTVISAVDVNNNRLALLHEDATEIGNFGNDRLSLRTSTGWILATGDFTTGKTAFEELGMHSNGYAAAKKDGKWGVIDTSGGVWKVQPIYDAIVCDELGRCYAQNAVFVLKDGKTLLIVDGEQRGDAYEDANPFAGSWAAVKINGKWGFIDINGEIQIKPQFDAAKSFGQHLAAVEIDGYWGYISTYGKMVIPPIFLEARSFSNGSAPIRTELGWSFITLLEYKEGATL